MSGKKTLYLNSFGDAIKNDLNTSLMLTVLYDLLKDNNVNYILVEEINDDEKIYILDVNKYENKDVSIEVN